MLIAAHFLAGEEEGVGWPVRGEGKALKSERPQRESPHKRAPRARWVLTQVGISWERDDRKATRQWSRKSDKRS